jgi:hypothetical protein
VKITIQGDPESSYTLQVINLFNNEALRVEDFRSGNDLNLSNISAGTYVVSINGGQRIQLVKQ